MKCALCQEDKQLRKSHVFPEFLYTPLYDEKHKYTIISSDSKSYNKRPPKGIYEDLLCQKCEGKFEGFENYASKVLFGGVATAKRKLQNRFVIEEIDYRRFKLFQLSLIWRAGISAREEFSQTNLWPPHKEKLRKMLYAENPGEPYEFGCVLIASPKVMNITKELIVPPEPIRFGSHRCFRAILAGLFWFFFTSGHSRHFTPQEAFLSKEGRLIIFNESSKSVEFITKLGLAFKKAGKI